MRTMPKDIKTILSEQIDPANAQTAWAKKLLKQTAQGKMTAHTPEEKAVERLITLEGGWVRSEKLWISKNSFPKAQTDALMGSTPLSVKKHIHLVAVPDGTSGEKMLSMNCARMDELAESL